MNERAENRGRSPVSSRGKPGNGPRFRDAGNLGAVSGFESRETRGRSPVSSRGKLGTVPGFESQRTGDGPRFRPIVKALLVWLIVLASGGAEAQPRKLTLGIYAPTVEFGAATARLAYIKSLASAIEASTGMQVDAQSYANLGALTRANVDFAIVDGPCYATNLGWKLLANANVGGGTSRAWALFAGAAGDLGSLRGKKLAYVAGCSDAAFVDHAMLESEVDAGFFGARVAKQDLTGALAEVASYRTAQAVFAPIAAAKGLTKIFETGSVPNPAFVVVGKPPAQIVDKVASAVLAFSGGGAIAGWSKPDRSIYNAFAGRLQRAVKAGVFAVPEPVRIDAKDVLVEPPSLREPGAVDVRRHWVRTSGRMD